MSNAAKIAFLTPSRERAGVMSLCDSRQWNRMLDCASRLYGTPTEESLRRSVTQCPRMS